MLSLAAPLALLGVVGAALGTQPPTIRLAAGVYEGPLRCTVLGCLEGIVTHSAMVAIRDRFHGG